MLFRSIALQPGDIRHVALTSADSPLRNGLFQVDVAMSDSASGARLFEEKAVAVFSVYGDSSSASGPVLIRGEWSARP